VREKLVAFLQEAHPRSLPRLRVDMASDRSAARARSEALRPEAAAH
jgi:hypothetical protein